jgi:hypothetical protein
MCAAETWTWIKAGISRLLAAQMRYLKEVQNEKPRDKK